MSVSPKPEVLISEVGPRDGLKSVRAIMPTADKERWISALYDAGPREIEVCSFVPAKHLPQMADAAEVMADESGLPDTNRYANPAQVRRLFRRLHRDWRARWRCTCAQHPRFGACQLPCCI